VSFENQALDVAELVSDTKPHVNDQFDVYTDLWHRAKAAEAQLSQTQLSEISSASREVTHAVCSVKHASVAAFSLARSFLSEYDSSAAADDPDPDFSIMDHHDEAATAEVQAATDAAVAAG
jgi:hypothetical protein